MFLRLVADSFGRRPRHKMLTGTALALGMAVVTAALSVSLDVGDRMAREFRSLGANLVVTPEGDSLPLEIGGIDFRPANAGAYLPEADLPKLKTIFWRNNIVGFAPVLETQVNAWSNSSQTAITPKIDATTMLIGTWAAHGVTLPDGSAITTGIEKTNPWWRVGRGRWFNDAVSECMIGSKFQERAGVKLGDILHVERASGTVALTVTGILSTGGPEDDSIVAPLAIVQQLIEEPSQYRKLYVSALTKPEDDFGRRNPATMNADEFERWSCSPYISSIAYSIKQVLPGSDVRVIRRVADGEGKILSRVQTLLWLVTFVALLAAALAVGTSSAASVIERRTEIGLMKALGARSVSVGFLLAAEQLVLAFVGGGIGYGLGILLAQLVGERIFGAAPHPSLLVFVVILGLAACVALLGSAIPLRRASRYQPAPILRGE